MRPQLEHEGSGEDFFDMMMGSKVQLARYNDGADIDRDADLKSLP